MILPSRFGILSGKGSNAAQRRLSPSAFPKAAGRSHRRFAVSPSRPREHRLKADRQRSGGKAVGLKSPTCGHSLRCYHPMMEDVLFIAIAEAVVGYVDENYGRIAAWLAAVAMVLFGIAFLVGLFAATAWWLGR